MDYARGEDDQGGLIEKDGVREVDDKRDPINGINVYSFLCVTQYASPTLYFQFTIYFKTLTPS